MIQKLEDLLLRFLQRRCSHPGWMVTADALEGGVDGLEVKWCRRCGALKTDWSPFDPSHKFITLEHWWRRPDPYLWRR